MTCGHAQLLCSHTYVRAGLCVQARVSRDILYALPGGSLVSSVCPSPQGCSLSWGFCSDRLSGQGGVRVWGRVPLPALTASHRAYPIVLSLQSWPATCCPSSTWADVLQASRSQATPLATTALLQTGLLPYACALDSPVPLHPLLLPASQDLLLQLLQPATSDFILSSSLLLYQRSISQD